MVYFCCVIKDKLFLEQKGILCENGRERESVEGRQKGWKG